MEKPLHVRVAEALGWRKIDAPLMIDGEPERMGREPVYGELEQVPRYDTDWSATGPLIERLGITLLRIQYSEPPEGALLAEPFWEAATGYWENYDGPSHDASESAATPLVAVCNLILKLHVHGQLYAYSVVRLTAAP